MRTFEYRLYPNRAQRQQLMACLMESRAIYNEMLETLKAQYEADGTFPTKYDLTARFKGRGGEGVPATTVQTLADRLSKALKRYLQMKDLGLPVGFPRFKTPNRWHSIQLRQYAPSRDVWLDDDGAHLHVPAKLGKLLKIKLHRPLEGTPVTAHLVLRADGHWYALIVCETAPQDEHLRRSPRSASPRAQESAPHPVCEHPAIGLDVGLEGVPGRLRRRDGGEPAPLSPRPETPGSGATRQRPPQEGQPSPPQSQT